MKTLILCGNPCLQATYFESQQEQKDKESSEIHRCERHIMRPGGKGIHISAYLSSKSLAHSLWYFQGKGRVGDYI